MKYEEMVEKAMARQASGMPQHIQRTMEQIDIANKDKGYVNLYFRGAFSGKLITKYAFRLDQGPKKGVEMAWAWFNTNYPEHDAILSYE